MFVYLLIGRTDFISVDAIEKLRLNRVRRSATDNDEPGWMGELFWRGKRIVAALIESVAKLNSIHTIIYILKNQENSI